MMNVQQNQLNQRQRNNNHLRYGPNFYVQPPQQKQVQVNKVSQPHPYVQS